MLKRIFVASAILFTLSMTASRASAALADCTTVTTLQNLIDDNALGGCTHLDKIFSNFVYNTGGQTYDAASLVHASHTFTASSTGLNDVHGWIFSLPGTWTTGFTLSYDISITGAPLQRIFAATDQEQSGLVPNSTNINDTQTTTPAGSYLLNVNGTSTALETHQQNPFAPLATSVHTSSVFSCGAPPCGLVSYEQDWFEEQAPTVPEPATFGLMGLGLLGIAAIRRRRVKQQ